MKCGVTRFLLAGMLFSAVFSLSLSAQTTRKVPAAIKYQAVLRDVNGAVLSDRSNVDIRVSLRQGTPTGTVVYQEEHTGLETNAYGLIHLQIGAGNPIGGAPTLREVPWGEDALYAQIEVQTDGTGYTQMGVSELLSVPYAFFAGNADNAGMSFDLKDGEIPMYDALDESLVASGIVQKGDKLYISSPANPDGGYLMPATKGGKNQVLKVKDATGELEWAFVEGGSGQGGSLRFDYADNGKFLFWDAGNDTVRPAPFLYIEADGQFHVMGDFIAKDKVVTDNLDAYLPKAQIFVGNADDRGRAQAVSGHLSLDENGKTELNLAYTNGLGIKAGSDGNQDTLYINSALLGGDSLWLQGAADPDGMFAYNKGRALSDIKVGVGTADPQETLHIRGGNVLFSNQTGADSMIFYWNAANGALRAGGVSDAVKETAYPAYSMGFGKGVKVQATHSFAFGEGSAVNENADYSFVLGKGAATFAPESFAIGNGAIVGATGTTLTRAIAFGNNATVTGTDALAIGNGASVGGENSISIGQNTINGANSFAFGINNGNSSNRSNALFIGNGNDAGEKGIAIGSNNRAGDKAIVIGTDLEANNGDIVIGYEDDATDPSIVLGTVGSYSGAGTKISIGTQNQHGENDVMMLGRWLGNLAADYSDLTMIGYDVYSADAGDLGMGDDPVFLFGVHGPLMGITKYGDVYFKGDLSANGWTSTSDFRLKDNIRPVSYPLTLADSLQPVSYYLKNDKKQRTRLGFIAQEVQQYFPCLVREGGNGMLSLDYMGLIPVLWDFSKQLRQENTDLKEEVAEQAARIDKLEAEIETIKQLLQANN